MNIVRRISHMETTVARRARGVRLFAGFEAECAAERAAREASEDPRMQQIQRLVDVNPGVRPMLERMLDIFDPPERYRSPAEWEEASNIALAINAGLRALHEVSGDTGVCTSIRCGEALPPWTGATT
jgi:hypothetical protein